MSLSPAAPPSSTSWELADACQKAWQRDPRDVVAGLGLVEALLTLDQNKHAIEQSHRVLAILDRIDRVEAQGLDIPPASGNPTFHGAWSETMALSPADAHAARLRLIRWRCHEVLASVTGHLAHYFLAHLTRPGCPTSQAALGCALARAGKIAEAIPFLRQAVQGDPTDASAAQALHQMLGDAGLIAEQQELAALYRARSQSNPELFPAAAWFAPADAAWDAASAALPEDKKSPCVVWRGAQRVVHSLAHVNRELCTRLLDQGLDLHLSEPGHELASGAVPMLANLAERLGQPLPTHPDLTVRLQWPPDFSRPASGKLVIAQPWEFGSIPCAWLDPMQKSVDEVWVPSRWVRDCFIQSGVPADKIAVVPLGVAPLFLDRPVQPFPLQTSKKTRFLFVGGTIGRKGIDVLLKCYCQAFSAQDDVCLVIKDMGNGTFYSGQTAEQLIAEHRARPNAPEIEYLALELSTEGMADLYASCTCLVHPYRGEGFGLPILEAMARGLPVIVTGYGPALEFCTASSAYFLPASVAWFATPRVGELPTVGRPWLVEPDQDALRYYLHHVADHPEEAAAKGAQGRDIVRAGWTWDHMAPRVLARLHHLAPDTGMSLESASVPATVLAPPATGAPLVSLCMIVKNEEHNLLPCLKSVAGLVDEMIIVDTGSTDNTKAIALQAGAKVVDFPWVDSFAAARNICLDHATGRWIFWMDADDRLDEANRAKLRALIASLQDENLGFVMKCLCLPDPQTGTATVVDHVRLFRRQPLLRWEYRIHEQILGSLKRHGGTVRWSDVVIHHTGYQDAALRQRKLERDLRLLQMEDSERPDDPFTLFNLGAVYLERNQTEQALQVLTRSLQRSHPQDSIVRKLYAQVAQCHRLLGQKFEALSVCQDGRRVYPHDPEILFQESLARHESGDLGGAIACLNRLLELPTHQEHFASVDVGLQTFKARHNLAVIQREAGNAAAAEEHWRLALAHQPSFVPALTGLGELYLSQQRWSELESILHTLQSLPNGAVDALLLQVKLHLQRREWELAKAAIHQGLHIAPACLSLRVLLTHALLQEGRDWTAAEQALLAVLALAPQHPEALSNLAVLRRQRSQAA